MPLWICRKCDFSFETDDPSRLAFCPNCGCRSDDTAETCNATPPSTVATAGDAGAPHGEEAQLGDSPASYPPETTDAPDGDNLAASTSTDCDGPKICSICCSEIGPDDDVVICPDCKSAYHKDCWEDNKGCATYGCRSANCLEVHRQDTDAPDGNDGEWHECPVCHMLIQPGQTECPVCRKNDTGVHVADNLQDFCGSIQRNLALLWRELCPCVGNVFRSVGHSLMSYAKFSGNAARYEFICYAMVYMLMCILVSPANTGPLRYIFFIATAIPTLALIVRRLHDTGLSGWHMFLLPILPLLLLVPTHSPRNSENSQTER